ncbi:MAG: helix-turn-helix transcriptional regulator [Lachnospiraceae bacterium]|nr:helix-turn-helix transcriptional regulator [Lachnospiraceae bacterium]
MAISYEKLWKKVKRKKLKKQDFQNALGMSSSTVAKLTNNKPVTMEVLERICNELNCNIGDIVEFVKE